MILCAVFICSSGAALWLLAGWVDTWPLVRRRETLRRIRRAQRGITLRWHESD